MFSIRSDIKRWLYKEKRKNLKRNKEGRRQNLKKTVKSNRYNSTKLCKQMPFGTQSYGESLSVPLEIDFVDSCFVEYQWDCIKWVNCGSLERRWFYWYTSKHRTSSLNAREIPKFVEFATLFLPRTISSSIRYHWKHS